MRARKVFVWVLWGVYAGLWIGAVATHYHWCGHDPAWAPPLFLVVASALAAIASGEAAPVAIFALGGLAAEWIGVHTGLPFGHYRYTAVLGPSVYGVPPDMACAWVILLLFARDLAWRVASRPIAAAALGAAIMTWIDLLLDPVTTRILGFWHWEQPGFYFGVPFLNFVGWFAVSALLLAAAPKPRARSGAVVAVGASVVAFFAAVAIVS